MMNNLTYRIVKICPIFALEPYNAVDEDVPHQPISKIDCSIVVSVARVTTGMTHEQALMWP